jgi:hypothetical protein
MNAMAELGAPPEYKQKAKDLRVLFDEIRDKVEGHELQDFFDLETVDAWDARLTQICRMYRSYKLDAHALFFLQKEILAMFAAARQMLRNVHAELEEW